MTISVYIDNNVWDFLLQHSIDLATALPRPEFCICITREAEFEIPPIPPEKEELRRFITSSIEKCEIKTDFLFGFADDNLPPDEQRVGGFDTARFATIKEIEFYERQRTRFGSKRAKTKLYKGEADTAIAARSFHSVVLSLDAKAGPINDAYKDGGKVVFLTDFDASGLTLADFIRAKSP